MTKYLDFEQVKADNPIGQVAERLGLELTKKGEQLRGPSPSGKGDKRSLCITPAKGVFYDFAAEKGGDVIELVSYVMELSAKPAAEWIAGTVPEERAENAPKPANEARGGFKPLDYLEADHPAVEALGFQPEDAAKIGCGFAPRGILRGQVAIPIRLDTGQLIGYIGIEEAVLPKEWKF